MDRTGTIWLLILTIFIIFLYTTDRLTGALAGLSGKLTLGGKTSAPLLPDSAGKPNEVLGVDPPHYDLNKEHEKWLGGQIKKDLGNDPKSMTDFTK